VLRSLRHQGAATRTELARRTGLAKATVGVIVSALDAAGAVVEDGPGPAAEAGQRGRGRPGRPVVLDGSKLLGLGLELNVGYVSAVVLDLAGRVRLHEHRSVAPDGRVDALLRLARDVVAALPGSRLVGAMVAVPGLVRGDDTTIAWTPNLGVEGADLAARVESAIGHRCQVEVGNDANCAAYAEHRHGAAADVRHAIYLTGTVGIGAGVIDDGRLLRGADGFAGEVGHMPLGDSTASCGCGRRGCWEASIGLPAMLAKVGLPELDTPVSTATAVADRAGEPRVAAGLDELGREVGLGLAALTNLLNPEAVVLGGYFVALGEHVLAPARAALDERLPSRVQRRPELRLSMLGLEAAATGAAELALEAVFSGDVVL